uniref:C-type lectin domain-containing protein n=1 Tax=Oryzias latipes TaxID=8090 RepID=H2LGT0_ORYLA
HTKCDDGWWPHNGFCYRVLPDSEAGSWQMSSEACSSQGANLTSIHSLSELEMLGNVFNLEVWIGLWKPLSSPAVEWSDGSPVTLTLWQQFQPVHNLTETPLCAKLEKKRLSAVCRRESRSPVQHSETWDEGCPVVRGEALRQLHKLYSLTRMF